MNSKAGKGLMCFSNVDVSCTRSQYRKYEKNIHDNQMFEIVNVSNASKYYVASEHCPGERNTDLSVYSPQAKRMNESKSLNAAPRPSPRRASSAASPPRVLKRGGDATAASPTPRRRLQFPVGGGGGGGRCGAVPGGAAVHRKSLLGRRRPSSGSHALASQAGAARCSRCLMGLAITTVVPITHSCPLTNNGGCTSRFSFHNPIFFLFFLYLFHYYDVEESTAMSRPVRMYGCLKSLSFSLFSALTALKLLTYEVHRRGLCHENIA